MKPRKVFDKTVFGAAIHRSRNSPHPLNAARSTLKFVFRFLLSVTLFVQIAFGDERSDAELEAGLANYSAQIGYQDLRILDPTTTTLAAWSRESKFVEAELQKRLKFVGSGDIGQVMHFGVEAYIYDIVLPFDEEFLSGENDIETQTARILNTLVKDDPRSLSLEDSNGFGWALHFSAHSGKLEREMQFIQTVEGIPILGSEATVTISDSSLSATEIYLSTIEESEQSDIPRVLEILNDPEIRLNARRKLASKIAESIRGEDIGEVVNTEDAELIPFILRTSDGLKPIWNVSVGITTDDNERIYETLIVNAEDLSIWTPTSGLVKSTPDDSDDRSCSNFDVRNFSNYIQTELSTPIGLKTYLCEAGSQSNCVFGKKVVAEDLDIARETKVLIMDGFLDDDGKLCGRYESPQEIADRRDFESFESMNTALETLHSYATYMLEELDWCGVNNQCKSIEALVFGSDEYGGAKYDVRTKQLYFGQKSGGWRHSALNPSVVGHELTHAVIRSQTSARVVLDPCTNVEGEEFGALEESFGDIIGKLLHVEVFKGIDASSFVNHGGANRWGYSEFGEVHYRDFANPAKKNPPSTVTPAPNRFPPDTQIYASLASSDLKRQWESDGGPQPDHYADLFKHTCRHGGGGYIPYVNSGIPNKFGFLLITAFDNHIPTILEKAQAAAVSEEEWRKQLLSFYFTMATKRFTCKNIDRNCDNFCAFKAKHGGPAYDAFNNNITPGALLEAFDLVGLGANAGCPES